MKKLITILLIVPLFGFSQPNIPNDKHLHFESGLVISTASTLTAYKLTGDRNKAAVIGFGTALLAGFTKELIDQKKYGGFDPNDLAATAIGGAFATFSFQISFDIHENFKLKKQKKINTAFEQVEPKHKK